MKLSGGSSLPKALGFQAINNITAFTYEYILDEKNVNANTLRENIMTYQHFENLLEDIKKQIEHLQQIEAQHNIIMNCQTNDSLYEYFIERTNSEILQSNIMFSQKEIQKKEGELVTCKNQRAELREEKKEKEKLKNELYRALISNDNFAAIHKQKDMLKELQNIQHTFMSEKQLLLRYVTDAKANVVELLKTDKNNNCLTNYYNELNNISVDSDIQRLINLIQEVKSYKNNLYKSLTERKRSAENEIQQLVNEKEKLTTQINDLQKQRLPIPKQVSMLIQSIVTECEKIERKPNPHVLCELLEITDDKWRNAVEGYMNTQKFHVIVHPDDFDVVLSIYDKLRAEKKIHSYGLVNARELTKYEEAPEGSLATVVTSKNKYAKQYVNMLLGKVKMCDSYDDLKKHRIAITKEGLKYQNHVVSAMNPEIFKNPYIGQNAIHIQLETSRKKLKNVIERLTKKQNELSDVNKRIPLCDIDIDIDVKHNLDVLQKIKANTKRIACCEENINILNNNTELSQKQTAFDEVDLCIAKLENECSNMDKHLGYITADIKTQKEKLDVETIKYHEKNSVCEKLLADHLDIRDKWNQQYSEYKKNKSHEQFLAKITKQKKSNSKYMDHTTTEMVALMLTYKSAYNFGAPASLDGYNEFYEEYRNLSETEILKFEDAIKEAKTKAEEEFKEQFLCKLQEYIKMAQNTFKEINRTLKNIEFNGDRYEFTYTPSKKYRKFYDMIMDDFNSVPGTSLFTETFRNSYKYEIEELFNLLKIDENYTTLDEMTDYRTYMDYDLKIIHQDGNYSLYSKTYNENSGGEAQTPFYIVIAASFVQLYKNGISDETFGLVMFDETFSNMDNSRAIGVIEFFKQLPLQVIMIAPPAKIEEISGAVQETVLVLRDTDISYTEAMYYEGV